LIQPDELSYSNRFKSVTVQVKTSENEIIQKGIIYQ
jgi:hypothetical protein